MVGFANTRRPWYNSVSERSMVLFLLFSGQCLGVLHYAFIDQAQTWDEAQQYCRVNYTDLATVHNMEELDRLAAAAHVFPSAGEAWIGLYTYPVYKWSIASDPYYVDAANTIPVFQMWGSGEPANHPGLEGYCVLMDNGHWYNYQCSQPLYSVCLSYGPGSQEMHVFVDTPMTWTQAQAYCRRYYKDLVSITSSAKNAQVSAMIPMMPPKYATWIGLYLEPWMWTDGSNSSFRNWMPTTPNLHPYKSCAVSNPLFNYWMDEPCENSNAFVCYGAFTCKLLFKITITTGNSSLNVNSYKVLKAMLTQMKAKLREQGETEYLKLQWKKRPNRKVFIKVEDQVEVESNCTEFP